MAEPTSAAQAAGAAGSSGWSSVASLVAAFLVALGTPWESVFWATAGAFFGAGFGPKTGRWRAIVGFPLCVLLAAKAGVVWAAWHGPVGNLSPHETAEAAAAVWGLVFHPAVALLVNAVPTLGQRWGVKPRDAS